MITAVIEKYNLEEPFDLAVSCLPEADYLLYVKDGVVTSYDKNMIKFSYPRVIDSEVTTAETSILRPSIDEFMTESQKVKTEIAIKLFDIIISTLPCHHFVSSELADSKTFDTTIYDNLSKYKVTIGTRGLSARSDMCSTRYFDGRWDILCGVYSYR